MIAQEYQRLEMTHEGYHVIVEFPVQPETQDAVKREIKEVLSDALPKYFEKSSRKEHPQEDCR